jgi:hypothetical protein
MESSMKNRHDLETLRLSAERCRHLAERASDSEASEALMRIAAEIETALPVLEDDVASAQR